MAEICIKLNDQDGPFGFKQGDPIEVREDGFGWGRCVSKEIWLSEGRDVLDWEGGFFIIKIPGLDPLQIMQYIAKHSDNVQPRQWSVDTTGVNLTKGFVVTTAQQLLNRISRKAA